MDTQSRYEVVFETDGEPIDVEKLTEFLYHFRLAYAAAATIYSDADDPQNGEEAYEIARNLHSKIYGLDWREIVKFAHADLAEENLGIADIYRGK